MAISDPRDISGLVLWYSAEHEAANYSDNTAMTQWTDLSGNGNHATAAGTNKPKWRSSTGRSSGAAVEFTATGPTDSAAGYFTLPTILAGATSVEILAEVKASGSSNESGLWFLNDSGDVPFYPFSDGKIYETFGTTLRKNSITPTMSIASWRRYGIWSAADDWVSRLDGTTQHTVSGAFSNTVSVGASATRWLGRDAVSGSPFRGFRGSMSCVVLYSRKLTTTERSDLEAWLTAHPAGGTAATIPAVNASLTGSGALSSTVVKVGVVAAALAGAGAFSATVSPVFARAADLSGSGAFAASVVPTFDRAAGLAGSGAFTAAVEAVGGVPERDANLTGSGAFTASSLAIHAVTGALTGSGAFTATVSVPGNEVDALLAGSGVFTADVETSVIADVSSRLGGRIRTGYGIATWSPAVVAPPVPVHVFDVAAAYSAPEFHASGLMKPLTETVARKAALRTRIVVDGRDVSFFRGVPTPLPSYSLIDPLLYGSSALEFPQVNGAFERLGQGALAWLRPEANVRYQLVDQSGAVVETVYRGFIQAININGATVTADVGGEISGRAALRDRQMPVFRVKEDIGTFVAHEVRRHAVSAFTPHFGPETGIVVTNYGGMSALDYLSDLLSRSTTNGGDQYTVGRRANGTWGMWLKDRETIDATAYFDDARLVADLHRDISEEPNTVYATAVDDEGRRITFRVYPGLNQGDIPPYPSDGPFGVGTTNADLDDPAADALGAMLRRLMTFGYITENVVLQNAYNAAVARGIRRLQDDAGLTESGTMNAATWRALYSLDATGYSLRQATTLPAAQRSAVKKWFRTSSGALLGRNPNYDPHKIVVDRSIAVGTGFDRAQTRDFARAELTTGDNWVGQLTCHLALIAGEHNPGDPLDAADVLSPLLVKPGMNIWAPQFDGGTLFHVSGVEVPAGGGAPVLTLDTRARDTMKAWEVITRNRESRINPARSWIRQNRSSTVDKDALATWDAGLGGLVDKTRLKAGWNVIPVVAGQEGTVQRIRVALRDDSKFAVAVFGKRVSAKWLNGQVAAPLTEAGTAKWDKPATQRRMDEKLLLYVAGGEDQACGYWPGRETNDAGEASGDPLTGKWQDDAGFAYRTFGGAVIYLAIWVPSANVLPAGRVFRNQGEEGS